MKKWSSLLIACLLLVSLTACTREPVSIDRVHAGEYMEFSSLEEFEQAVLDARSSWKVINCLTSLGYFYVPAGIPEEYTLEKITVDETVVAFWYTEQPGEEGFVFLSGRHDIRARRNLRKEEWSLFWTDDGDQLAMHIPKGYRVKDEEKLMYTDRYLKPETGDMIHYVNHPVEFVSVPSEKVISPKGPVLTVKSVAEDKRSVIFLMENTEDVNYAYGEAFTIEVLRDGQWYTTDYGPKDVPAIGYTLLPGDTVERTFYLAYDQNDNRTFPDGTYRVVMDVSPNEAWEEAFWIAGEFTVE